MLEEKAPFIFKWNVFTLAVMAAEGQNGKISLAATQSQLAHYYCLELEKLLFIAGSWFIVLSGEDNVKNSYFQ